MLLKSEDQDDSESLAGILKHTRIIRPLYAAALYRKCKANGKGCVVGKVGQYENRASRNEVVRMKTEKAKKLALPKRSQGFIPSNRTENRWARRMGNEALGNQLLKELARDSFQIKGRHD